MPTAGGPVRKRWRKVAFRTLAKSWNDSLFGMSSQAAFVGNTVDVILNNDQTDLISVGLFISLWAGSSAMTAFVESINIAYCQHEFRHPVIERFFALGLYVGALAPGILLVPLLAIGPDYLPELFPVGWRPTVSEILGWVYYPGLAIGLILLLTTLYKVAPKPNTAGCAGCPAPSWRLRSFWRPAADLACTCPTSTSTASPTGRWRGAGHPDHLHALLLLQLDGDHHRRPITRCSSTTRRAHPAGSGDDEKNRP